MANEEKERQIAELILNSFAEKTPLDYDILDSMSPEMTKIFSQSKPD